MSHLEEHEENVQLFLAAPSVKVLATGVQEDADQPHSEVGVVGIQGGNGAWGGGKGGGAEGGAEGGGRGEEFPDATVLFESSAQEPIQYRSSVMYTVDREIFAFFRRLGIPEV